MSTWDLNEEAFNRLLACFDANDRENAAEQYEALRRKLVKFFEWRGSAEGEELADETLDRAARKLQAGSVIEGGFSSYAYGIARMILLETRRQSVGREAVPLEKLGELPAPTSTVEVLQECFQACLEKLPADQRHLIIEYYQREKIAKIETRKALAESLQMPLNALRIRACRIRAALEECVRGCTA